MLDDLLKQIEGLLREGKDSKDGEQKIVSITTGDNCTVVVGDGNQITGRRRSDRPDAGPADSGRRQADQASQLELEQLRYQVKALERLVEHLLLKKGKRAFKRKLGVGPPPLKSSDAKPRFCQMSQSIAIRVGRSPQPAISAPARAVSGSSHLFPPNFIHSRMSQS